MEEQLKTSCLAGNELVPSMIKKQDLCDIMFRKSKLERFEHKCKKAGNMNKMSRERTLAENQTIWNNKICLYDKTIPKKRYINVIIKNSYRER